MLRIRALRSRFIGAASLALVSLFLLIAPVLADGGAVIYPHLLPF